jgi:hypothetical protein
MDKVDSLGAHTYVQMTFFLGPESSLAAPSPQDAKRNRSEAIACLKRELPGVDFDPRSVDQELVLVKLDANRDLQGEISVYVERCAAAHGLKVVRYEEDETQTPAYLIPRPQ